MITLKSFGREFKSPSPEFFLQLRRPGSSHLGVVAQSDSMAFNVVGWPSGLRRQFKALVSSEAWVRIPLQSKFSVFLITAIVIVVVVVLPLFLFFACWFCLFFVRFASEHQPTSTGDPTMIPPL